MSHERTRRRPQQKPNSTFPETLEEYVDKDNPVRFIDAFVESLNLEKLGFKHSIPCDLCRPSYFNWLVFILKDFWHAPMNDFGFENRKII